MDDLDIGAPGPGEVRIKVRAIGVNRAEAMFRAGNYGGAPALPSRIGYEASGEVEKVGNGVMDFAPGDIVSTIPAFSMAEYGV
jgi:NADPH:quinone reductase-like Zn-dependent oxidoreductase